MVEEKAYVRHAVRNPRFHSRSLLFSSLTIPARQFRCYHLRVIYRRDNIPAAA
jgi:hypothetical protein